MSRAGLLLAVLLARVAAAQEVRTDWPMSRGDARGSGAVVLAGAPGGPLKAWQFQASSHVWGYQPGMAVWSSAAIGVAGGRAIVVAGSYDNNLYGLDALTGQRRWRFTTGGGVYSAPVLWRGRERPLVFAGSSDRLLYAIEAESGRRHWVHTIKSWRPTMGGARLSSPCVGRARGGDAVFVAHWVWDKSLAGHLQAGGVTAVEALSGRALWTAQLGDNQLSSPVYRELDGSPGWGAAERRRPGRGAAERRRGRLFVASENGNLYALDADSGEKLWSHTDRNAIKASPAVFSTVDGPRVVIGSKFGRVRCLDARDGRELWTFKTGNWVDGSAAVEELAGNARVLVGSYDGNLYALDGRTGRMLWSYRTDAGVYSSPALLRERGQLRVLVSSWDHHLHCVDGETGRGLWKVFLGRPLWDSVPLGESIWASPSLAVIGGQSWVFLGSYAGPLHAIPVDEAARSGLARPGSNRRFWVTLPMVMLCTAALTLMLTWWSRRRQRRRG
jgi:outer membrane protein assembly factor BamB